MATYYTEIYARAIFRFADYKFLQQNLETREDVLEKYLFSAKTDFMRVCVHDLSDCDDVNKCFNQDLDDQEIEILSLGISYYWLNRKTLDSRLLKNVLNTKEYQYYSPAMLLKEVQTLHKTIRKEFLSKMRQYSFDHGNIRDLKS